MLRLSDGMMGDDMSLRDELRSDEVMRICNDGVMTGPVGSSGFQKVRSSTRSVDEQTQEIDQENNTYTLQQA